MVTLRDIAWTAGFLEGEGCFTHPKTKGGAVIAAGQVQQEPLQRLQSLYGGNIYVMPCSRWQLSGPQATGLAMTIYPLMSPRRREQIRKMLSGWRMTRVSARYRTHCPRGHHYSGENLILRIKDNGWRERYCRACISARALEHRRNNPVRLICRVCGLVFVGSSRTKSRAPRVTCGTRCRYVLAVQSKREGAVMRAAT